MNSSSPSKLQLEPLEREAALCFGWPPAVRHRLGLAPSPPHPSFLPRLLSFSLILSHSAQRITAAAEKGKEADGCVCVIRAASSPDVVQLRVRRGLAGHVVGVDAAPVSTAPSNAGQDGQRKRGQGHLRASGGGDTQHRRAQALQPAQGEGHRAALPGDHRVLQDHRRRPEAEAGIDPARQEERREARIPCLKISSPLHLLYSLY